MEQATLNFVTGKADKIPVPIKTEFTGDPFVDMGALVMDTLPFDTVEEKIRFATDVYVDRWGGKIHSVFLHSKITTIHATGKPERQRKDSLAYYLGILRNENAVAEGYCRICAHKGPLFPGGRGNYPLVGSGDFINFHHFHEAGLLLCGECLIKLFFLPLGIVECGDKLMILQPDDAYSKALWQADYIQENLDKISRGSSKGMLKANLLNPQNALFNLAGRLIEKFDLLEKTAKAIRLVYFSNFGAKANMEFHDLPNYIFSFLKRVCQPDLKTSWTGFVKTYYRFRKSVHFDEEKGEWVEKKKKEMIQLNHEEYSGTNRNTIYERLLSGKTISGYLCRRHKKATFPIMIAITYMKEVRNMRQEQIDLIRSIADKIIGLSQKEENFKKFITPIEGAAKAYELRAAILKCVKAHHQNGEPEPFIRLREYVEYLFPDGQYWSEVRDLLLICLYEKLHELRIDSAEVSTEDIAEPEKDAVDMFNG
ncbi:type I-B CRISPR-associated protein Cas8b1/Cst1 [Desulfonema magnum]|uniref:CRISPR-associated protein Cas8b1/Cst1, subtype I-B/TNEAP n=1 Tax=Desulfonema magnum TaxID=45655 RepID=A0A975BXY5_9BACT|nr:type I-B CRISPR-associated protein Cas8b1/Cst1 [Desulfonema magnum]QTA93743.1 CRISPR-associated protein Cas8b1/Cst1, subtype I-B/TNEAP [Desulfonema magnum]